MHSIQQILDGLKCFTNNQHHCLECPFNPHPGMLWPYGCNKGQSDIIDEAEALIQAMRFDLGKTKSCKTCKYSDDSMCTTEDVPRSAHNRWAACMASLKLQWEWRGMSEKAIAEREWESNCLDPNAEKRSE